MSATMREMYADQEPTPARAHDVVSRQGAARWPASPADHLGSYGRGIYAGQSTYGLDFNTPGSYGRGIYAGQSTDGLDDGTPGSYGRGIYADHRTFHIDFRRKDSYARGMLLEQPLSGVERGV